MTIFTGKMQHNADGTTTWINPDGSILAHGKIVAMNAAARKKVVAQSDREANYASHHFGQIDDCIRCLDCEVAPWNAYDRKCDA